MNTSVDTAFYDDSSAYLGLRGAGKTETTQVAESVQSDLGKTKTYQERKTVARSLGIAKTEIPEHEIRQQQERGERLDARGRRLFSPEDDHVLQDCDPAFYGKSPDEILEILQAREDAEPRSFDDFAALMQPDVTIRPGGGGSSGRRRHTPHKGGLSAVDQAAIHSVMGAQRRP